MRAILADLGDRVKAGQVLIQLDKEKQQYTYQQQQAALARTLAQYGAPDPQHLPEVERRQTSRRQKQIWCRRIRHSRARTSSSVAR